MGLLNTRLGKKFSRTQLKTPSLVRTKRWPGFDQIGPLSSLTRPDWAGPNFRVQVFCAFLVFRLDRTKISDLGFLCISSLDPYLHRTKFSDLGFSCISSLDPYYSLTLPFAPMEKNSRGLQRLFSRGSQRTWTKIRKQECRKLTLDVFKFLDNKNLRCSEFRENKCGKINVSVNI